MLKGLSNRYLLSAFLCLAGFNTSYAYSHWVNPEVFVAGGGVFSRLQNNSDVAINDSVVNRYSANTKTTWQGLWGLGAAYYSGPIMSPALSASLGVAAYATSFGNVNGIEYPFYNAGVFDALNYKFHVRSTAAFVEGRLYYTDYIVQPYFLVGIGAAWNRLSDYQETPINPDLSAAAVSPQFGSNTKTEFAFELGLGLQYQFYTDFKHNIRYSGLVDYRYLNFGKGELSPFPAQTANDHLKIDTISTQGVMVTLKASFC
jgi:opacity protein-like surface antigen